MMWECRGGNFLKFFMRKETFELQRKGQGNSRDKIKETSCVWEWCELNAIRPKYI